MNDQALVLNIAEVPYPEGGLHFRYARRPDPGGKGWVRHGLFQSFHPNGQLAQEGCYLNGLEDGLWRSYHENGQLAAEGQYLQGREVGTWSFWNPDGALEAEESAGSPG